MRALAVFVVATPCPLILAAPIALLSGVSRAARAGVIVKGGGVIERLGEVRTVLLDKTGTLTLGTPEVERVVASTASAARSSLRLAASLDQLSAHALAEALVHDAERRGLVLSFPDAVEEPAGRDRGRSTDGASPSAARAGSEARGYDGEPVTRRAEDGEPGAREDRSSASTARLAGAIVMADHAREDAPRRGRRSPRGGDPARGDGHRRPAASADDVGRQLGVDRVYAEQTPEEKLEVVRRMQASPELEPVVMVGDGVNDAPALALADVGIAMGDAGATAASETADAVIVVDRVDRVADAIRIGRRSLSSPDQSVASGWALAWPRWSSPRSG